MILTYQSKLIKKTIIAPHIYHLQCSLPENPDWSYKAGQYMIFHVPQTDGHPVRRLYSIASPPSQKSSIDFIIEMVPNGIGSKYVESLKENDMITLQGPAGIFTHRATNRPSIYLATGTGIAPMYSMIHDFLNNQENPQPLYLFWGLKTCEDLYIDNDLTALAKSHPQFYLRTCFSRLEDLSQVKGSVRGYTELGRVTVGLERLLSTKNTPAAQYDYYLCGSKHVVEALREYLQAAAVPKEQVFFEKFTT